MTLKTVLRNFLNHVETVETRRQIAEDLFDIEFQKLKELTEKLKQHTEYTVNEGELEVNRRKNRYKDILPYDHTRVVVSEYPGVPGSDYVNANYIKGASGSLAYIASQGPLPNTVADFWRMIWECEVQVIVMACNERESGKYKCEGYWPNEEGETERQYGNITVELVKWRQVCPDFLVRTLKYRCLGEEERSLCQFHYTTWPDHGVPNTVQPILDMVRLMRDCQASEAVPILIHCSAGCGRTGTICAIDYVWSLMRLGKLYDGFSLFEIVSDMRRQRIAMVQTKEQYILVHRAVSALFEQQLRVIDNHTYENLDGDGQPLMLKELQKNVFPETEHIYEDVSSLIAFEKDPKDSKMGTTRQHHTFSFSKSTNNEMKTIHVYENLDGEGQPRTHNVKNIQNLTVQNVSTGGGNELEIEIGTGGEKQMARRRNSQILQKLCQEESVKRLISGWNKTVVEKPDNLPQENYDDEPQKSEHICQMTVEPYQQEIQQSSSTSTMIPSTAHSNRDYFTKQHSKSEHTSPSEKLIGKATVIRRPSIAKLKALFEKSHGAEMTVSCNEPIVDEGRRRVRPLGRSHSHHVPRGRLSPSSDTSESEVRRNVERERSVRRIVSPLAREVATARVKNKQPDKNDALEVIGNGNVKCHSEEPKKPAQSSVTVHSSEHNGTTQWFKDDMACPDVKLREQSALKVGCIELRTDKSSSWYGEHESKSNCRAKWYSEENDGKPPELPIKKKFLNAKPEVRKAAEMNGSCNSVPVDNSSNESAYQKNPTEHISPVEDQGPPRLPEKKVIGRNASIKHKQRNEMLLNRIDGVVQSRKSVSIPLVEADRRTVLTTAAPKECSLTLGQSFKNHPARKGDTIADRYTNVNLTTQKNMTQIENTIKCHPRGAIIDLTSRTSFVETTGNSNKTLINEGAEGQKCNAIEYETLWVTSSQDQSKDCSNSSTLEKDVSKSSEVEVKVHSKSNGDAKSEINKNLLLHSPPPRSRRPHLSKGNVKTKVEGETTTETSVRLPTEKSSNISSDQEINKAVKDLNTIGYLLDALATQTLEDLKKETPLPECLETIKKEEPFDKPNLPIKQKSSGKSSDSGFIQVKDWISAQPTNANGTSMTNNIKRTDTKAVASSVPLPIQQKVNEEKQSDPREMVYNPNNPNLLDMPNIERPPAVISREYEYIYPLQKSASAPHTGKMFSGALNHQTVQQQHHQIMTKDRHLSYYQPKQQWDALAGPPKPPRTFTHVPQQNMKYDGGRLLVSVASPKALKPEETEQNVFRYDGLKYQQTSSKTLTGHYPPNYSAATSTYTYPDDLASQQAIMDSYSSQPTSPIHSSYPPVMVQGIRNPQPLSYRTYPSYPEIHSVRVTPHHVPLDPSSLHRPSQAPSYPAGHYKHSGHPSAATTSSFHGPSELNVPALFPTGSHSGRGHSMGPSYRYPEDKTSATPDYGEVPVVPVYTMIRPEERHRVQWDSSVDEQQRKGTKTLSTYENIYNVPKECVLERVPGSGGASGVVGTPNYDPTAYAVINKAPQQQQVGGGHELRHSQSDASVYTVVRASKTSDIDRPSQPPLYSQVIKPKKDNNNGSTDSTQRNRRSRDDMDLQPIAPPRNKRQVHLRRSVADGGLGEQGYPIDSHNTWHSDSEEEPPAVPAKTKGAYIAVDPEGRKVISNTRKSSVRDGASATSQGGLGGTLSRALGKLNLLTKLTNKTEVTPHPPPPLPPPQPQPHEQQQGRSVVDRTNADSGFQKETSPTKKASGPPGLRSPIFGFPHRMHRRPKGPREPPEQWTQV